jgi:tRNA-dihydrouridine synthase C
MQTPTGLPVQIQLLGGDPNLMAAAAGRACELGATAIDLNFGCPARTVNRHDGGATLLKHPTRLRAIVAAVRSAIPVTTPVSAKLRLGWDNVHAITTNAAMAAEGGAAWLTIHARTRMAGYAPPVDWPQIGRVREQLGLPIVANGDIWTLDDFRRCRGETGCHHFMLGRGALANPLLTAHVARELGLLALPLVALSHWTQRLERLSNWMHYYGDRTPEHHVCRYKQWLSLAARFGNFTEFDRIKCARDRGELLDLLPT